MALDAARSSLQDNSERRTVRSCFGDGSPTVNSGTRENKKRESKGESFGSEVRERKCKRESDDELAA